MRNGKDRRHMVSSYPYSGLYSKMASMNGNNPKSAVARLKALLARRDKLMLCPGVYDGFTARIAMREGLECLYMVCTVLNTKASSIINEPDNRLEQVPLPLD
jgi:hypothetical protein